jgi:hypothetical protein
MSVRSTACLSDVLWVVKLNELGVEKVSSAWRALTPEFLFSIDSMGYFLNELESTLPVGSVYCSPILLVLLLRYLTYRYVSGSISLYSFSALS